MESRKASTVLRLVHSGFGNEPHWDDIYEGVKRGWEFELRGLKHYIENHFTTKRYAIWIKKEHKLTLEEAWNRIMNLFENNIESLKEHDSFILEEKTGEVYAGLTMINDPPYTFAGTLTNFNNSVLRFENYKTGDKIISYFFIAGYGVSKQQLDKLKTKWKKIYDTIFTNF